ncbi:MAG TPA: sigma-70 family RNA polymerase sigma factor [Mycobacteriales bacterium]|nr:sigma-70 family RNA polymerase sigma factor [Mycobacteriales bacterium]
MEDDLAEFCRQERRRLVAALVLMCGSLPMAEDLAQETLARVCRDWKRIRRLEAPGAYAHRVAVNLATSAFRRRAAERRASARLDPPAHAAPEPDSATAIAVRDALQRLRPEQRKVLVLRYFLGYSVADTANVLTMPEGTVKTHALRGLSTLRGILGTSVTAADMEVRGA